MTFINQAYQRADAFLFGRRTYELFAGFWGAVERARAAAEDPVGHPIAAALNAKPKYLASTTVTEPGWADTTVLPGDLAGAIGELKATREGELQVHGSGTLVPWLLDHDLVDEITLLIVPVILGQGARLFPDAGPDIALDLVDSRTDSKGVTIQVYRPNGRPQSAPSHRS
jgi:dihydrofolate reductase